jgi:type VI protein secretion system component Hcp
MAISTYIVLTRTDGSPVASDDSTTVTDPVTGEAVTGAVPVESFQLGIAIGGSGTPTLQVLAVAKLVDGMSPQLFEMCAAGTLLQSVTVFALPDEGSTASAVRYIATTVEIKEITPSDADTDEAAGETVTFAYTALQVEQAPAQEGTPPQTLPESPLAVGLPLLGAATGVAVLAQRARRHRADPVEPT